MVQEFRAPSAEALWAIHARADVVVATLRQSMARDAWESLCERTVRGRRARLGEGEVCCPQTALLGLGERRGDARPVGRSAASVLRGRAPALGPPT